MATATLSATPRKTAKDERAPPSWKWTWSTSTGRIYQLVGTPGWNADAEYVWRRWIAINQVPQWEDVSKEVWSDHLALKCTPSTVKPEA